MATLISVWCSSSRVPQIVVTLRCSANDFSIMQGVTGSRQGHGARVRGDHLLTSCEEEEEDERGGGAASVSTSPAVVPESLPQSNTCGNCNTQFSVFAELEDHRKICPFEEDMEIYDQDEVAEETDRPVSPPRFIGPPPGPVEMSEDELMEDRFPEGVDDENEEEEGDVMTSSPSVQSDLNQEVAGGSSASVGDDPVEGLVRTPADTANLDSMGMPDSNVKLESLQNTSVAVAQFAENNDVNTNDLAMLQSTLYHLQQQQLVQLQMLQQLQQHIVMGANPAQIAAQLPPFLPPGFNPMLLQTMNKSLLAAMQNQKGGEEDSAPDGLQDEESVGRSSGCTTPRGNDQEGQQQQQPDTPGAPQEVNMPANMPLNPNNPMLSSDLAKLELFKKDMAVDMRPPCRLAEQVVPRADRRLLLACLHRPAASARWGSMGNASRRLIEPVVGIVMRRMQSTRATRVDEGQCPWGIRPRDGAITRIPREGLAAWYSPQNVI
ncbi:hypothetical protein CAPTEDRAFT_194379 [Capitella teleta]|uniref:C2H2-type domain-containing protein n=1 Tax=Capitella teleta TaxID=283909 RepID=R7UXV6_CAPTE|nr:hypothetical protein CAPTEDRAFT_194379 [Capitella teleta]|eukprot:ELU11408.1 hypothetical protein CAPTEDRAFT_194379 [Capitella teleta]